MLFKLLKKTEEKNDNPFQGMKPFIKAKMIKNMPSEVVIDQMFQNIINDFSISPKNEKIFSGFNVEEKWEFVQWCQDRDAKTPHPQWLVSKLERSFDIRLVRWIEANFRSLRKSWINQFFDLGGHLLVFRELAKQTAYHQNFLPLFSPNQSEIAQILRTLRTFVETEIGIHHLVAYSQGIEIIVQSFDIFDAAQFEEVLRFLFPYLSIENQVEKVLENIYRLAQRYHYKYAFSIFADKIVSHKELENPFTIFVVELYELCDESLDARVKLSFEYVNGGVIEAFHKVTEGKSGHLVDRIKNVAKTVAADLRETQELFKGDFKKLFNGTDFSKELCESETCSALFCQLTSLKRNCPDVFDECLNFLYCFLIYVRKNGRSAEFIDVAMKATEFAVNNRGHQIFLEHVPLSTIYQHLYHQYFFVSDEDLQKMDILNVGQKLHEIPLTPRTHRKSASPILTLKKASEMMDDEGEMIAYIKKLIEPNKRKTIQPNGVSIIPMSSDHNEMNKISNEPNNLSLSDKEKEDKKNFEEGEWLSKKAEDASNVKFIKKSDEKAILDCQCQGSMLTRKVETPIWAIFLFSFIIFIFGMKV